MTGQSTTGRSRRRQKLRLAALACSLLGAGVGAACYSTGDGTDPPLNTLYFPTGLTVSAGGNVLYVVNSDFDLQYNGGTVQSYDLNGIRNDAVRWLLGVNTASLPWEGGAPPPPPSACPYTVEFDASTGYYPQDPNNTNTFNGAPGRQPLGEACAPPVDSKHYWQDSVIIGAFATDLQLSVTGDRLFTPVRGDATLTWLPVISDKDSVPTPSATHPPPPSSPFYLNACGISPCNGSPRPKRVAPKNQAGLLTDYGNTRGITMPGEPFGMAQTEDGTAIALTHQTSTNASLYLTGIPLGSPRPNDSNDKPASLQFIVSGVVNGGIGMVTIPHDPAIPSDPSNPLRPAFLMTSSTTPEVDLLRYYTDEGYQPLVPPLPEGGSAVFAADAGVPVVTVADAGDGGEVTTSSNYRPFLIKERAYTVGVNASGTNSRGIAIDPTPRLACKAALDAEPAPAGDPRYLACAQLPARVFIANRSPATLIFGQLGGWTEDGRTYDPDLLTLLGGNYPLPNGPSNVYVAPIVDSTGRYALRVFVVCFDSQVIVVWDPDAQRVENTIRTGPGPYAMAFDNFDLAAVARHDTVPFDARAALTLQSARDPSLNGKPALRTYRFAYVASFTDSFVQMVDLDQSFKDDRLIGSSFESVTYSLGAPTLPKGSQ